MYPEERAIDEHLKVVRLMAGSMMGGVVVFGAVVLVLLGSPESAPVVEELPAFFPGAVAGVVLLALVMGQILRRRSAGSQTDLASALQRHRSRVLASFVAWEGGGLLGVLLALVTGTPEWGFALAGGSLLMMGFAWPRRQDIELPPPSPAAADRMAR